MQAERDQVLREHLCLELREEPAGGHWVTELAARQDSRGPRAQTPGPATVGRLSRMPVSECSVSLHHLLSHSHDLPPLSGHHLLSHSHDSPPLSGLFLTRLSPCY